jgi:hypothetical protein
LDFSAFLRLTAETLHTKGPQDWSWLEIGSLGFLLTQFFTEVVIRLLERAGPSQDLIKCLNDMERVIDLLCCCADSIDLVEHTKGEKARITVLRYFSTFEFFKRRQLGNLDNYT